MALQIKRVYDEISKSDGKRILVDGIWPRGVSKEKAQLDEWLKKIAPSSDLRKWFDHDPDKFAEFKATYEEELKQNDDQAEAFAQLKAIVQNGKVTLLTASKEETYNHAQVLKKLVQN